MARAGALSPGTLSPGVALASPLLHIPITAHCRLQNDLDPGPDEKALSPFELVTASCRLRGETGPPFLPLNPHNIHTCLF